MITHVKTQSSELSVIGSVVGIRNYRGSETKMSNFIIIERRKFPPNYEVRQILNLLDSNVETRNYKFKVTVRMRLLV